MGWPFMMRKAGLNYPYNVYQGKFNKQTSNIGGKAFHCLKIKPFLNEFRPTVYKCSYLKINYKVFS